MATYVRQSSFSDGDTITAALFNNEFNQLVNAFNVATGHTHDGSTAGDGGPISNLFSNALVFGTNTDNDVVITFNANSNDGVLTWMEDEDYFQFSDDLLLTTTEKVQFRDTAIYINSSTDGQLDIVADTEIQIAATTIDMNGNADISGNLGVGGNLTVTGTTTFNGGTITMGDASTDNVVFGADVDSHIIPDDDDTYDLGSSTQEWRNLYIDGTANIDSLVADTADINGGTIDAANITVGSGKTLDVSAGTLTLADNQISGDKVEGGTINATTINTLTYGSITDGTITVTAFVDEDNMASNSATLIPTQQSVKAYVDAQDTAQDLDLVSDSGTIAIDLDGETLTVTGGEGIDTSASSNTLTITGEDATTSNKGIASFNSDDFNVSSGAVTLATTSTAAELNLLDGTTAGTIVASKGVAVDANKDITGFRNITLTGELDAGSLDVSGNVDVDGTLETDALSINGTAVTSTAAELNILDGKAFLDEDNMASNSATGIASQQSIKAYVDTQITAEDLDITTDSGTIAIDLDSETLTVSGGTGLDSSATGNAVTLAIDSTVATLTGSQTLTNKSLTAPTLTGTATVASLDISGDIDVDGTTNLDVVDIDGAVDMASTLAVGGVVTANAGVVVDNITIDGNEIDVGSGDLTLDVAGDIFLNADGGQVYFQDGSTLHGSIDMTSGLILRNHVSDADVFIQGNDGGSTINMLTLDASAAGAATFSSTVTAGAGQFTGVTGTSILKAIGADSNGQADIEILSTGTTGSSRLFFSDTAAQSGSITYSHNTNLMTASSAGGITLDAAGDIKLDADSSNIYLADGGTDIGLLSTNNQDLNIRNLISNKDIYFQGNDGGSTITALTLNMSEAGEATFNSDILLGDGKVARFGTDQDFRIGFDGSTATLHNVTSDSDILFKGNDGGSTITALTLDMSNAGAATFNNHIKTQTLLQSIGADTQTNVTASQAIGIHLQNTSNTDGNFVPIDFYNSTGFVTGRIGAEFQDAGDRNTDLYFATRANGGSLTERFRIASDGFGDYVSSANDIIRFGGANSGSITFRNDTSNQFVMHTGSSDDFVIGTGGNNDRLTITAAGDATFDGAINLSGNLTFTAADGREIIAKESIVVTIDSDDNDTGRVFGVRSGASGSYESLMNLSEASGAVFNEDGVAALDFRVESDSNTHMLFVDAGNNRVGLGTSAPADDVHMDKGTGVGLMMSRTTGATSGQLGNIRFGNLDFDSNLANIGAHQDGSKTAAYLSFETQSAGAATAERMRIQSDGKIRLGNSGDHVLVDVSGSNAALQLIDNNQSNPPTLRGNGPNFTIENGGVERMRIDTGVVFNETGIDQNFRVESNNNANMLFVDGGNDRITIGGNDGTGSLHVKNKDNSGADVHVVVQNTTNNRIAGYKIQDESGNTGINLLYDNGGNTATLESPIGNLTLDVAGDIILDADGGDLEFKDGSAGTLHSWKQGVYRIPEQAAGTQYNNSLHNHTNNYQYIIGGSNGLILADNTDQSNRIIVDNGLQIAFDINGVSTAKFTQYGGIAFGSDNSAATTLDDYEEGTWTPQVTDGTNNATMYASAGNGGRYTKIGRAVTFTAQVTVETIGSVGANAYISGLPFTNGSSGSNRATAAIGYGSSLNITAGRALTAYVELNQQNIYLFEWGATTGTSGLSGSQITNGGTVFMSGTYYIS